MYLKYQHRGAGGRISQVNRRNWIRDGRPRVAVMRTKRAAAAAAAARLSGSVAPTDTIALLSILTHETAICHL